MSKPFENPKKTDWLEDLQEQMKAQNILGEKRPIKTMKWEDTLTVINADQDFSDIENILAKAEKTILFTPSEDFFRNISTLRAIKKLKNIEIIGKPSTNPITATAEIIAMIIGGVDHIIENELTLEIVEYLNQSGINNSKDPMSGSHFIEKFTDSLTQS